MGKDGEEVKEAREDIQGYRTVETLAAFTLRHVAPDVTDVTTVEELDEMVEDDGVVVLGLFSNTSDKYPQTYAEVAKRWRRYVTFAQVTGLENARHIAEAYEV